LLDFIEFNNTVEVDGHVDIVWFIRSYLSWNKSTVWSLAGIISRWVSEVCENRSWSIFDIGFHCVANPRHGGALSELKQRLKDDGEEVEKGSWLGRHDGNINTGPPSRFYEHRLVEVDYSIYIALDFFRVILSRILVIIAFSRRCRRYFFRFSGEHLVVVLETITSTLQPQQPS
jgi:hypothetical protein